MHIEETKPVTGPKLDACMALWLRRRKMTRISNHVSEVHKNEKNINHEDCSCLGFSASDLLLHCTCTSSPRVGACERRESMSGWGAVIGAGRKQGDKGGTHLRICLYSGRAVYGLDMTFSRECSYVRSLQESV
ncbi:hypothetical protein AOLI_G00209600 [Acnodon oligacanthus]